MECVLSSMGAHRGNIKIFKDDHLSGKHNSVPSKPSFNGFHTAKLFLPSTLPGGSNKLYADVVSAEKNFMSWGAAKRAKLEVWVGLEKLKPYLEGLTLHEDQKANFEGLVEAWGYQFIRAFGEQHVTPYIVRSSQTLICNL